MDMFKLGQMLGNAYGNLWTANANKREDKQAEEVRSSLSKPIEQPNEIAELGPTVGTLDANASIEDVNNAINQNAAISGGPQGIAYNKKASIVGNVPQRANNINPSDVTAQGGILGLDGSENTGLAWRPQFTAEDFDKAMRDKGIGKDARTRALSEYKTDLAAQAQKEMLPDIVKAINQGRTGDALMAMMQYKKYDPETVGMLAKDYQSAVQFNRQKELQDLALNNKLTLQNNAYQNKVAYKGLGGGRTTTTKQGKMQTANQLQTQINNLQKEIDMLPSGGSEFMAKSASRDKLQGELDALQMGGQDAQREYNNNYNAERNFIQSHDFNLNNWDEAAYLANDMIYRQAIPPKETIAKLKSAGAPEWVISGLEGSYKDIL